MKNFKPIAQKTITMDYEEYLELEKTIIFYQNNVLNFQDAIAKIINDILTAKTLGDLKTKYADGLNEYNKEFLKFSK